MTDTIAVICSDRRGEYLVVGEGETRDELQASGAWLAIDAPAEVRR